MRDLRKPGVDPNMLLLAAAIGLALMLVAGLVFGQALPQGKALDPRAALEISQRAVGTTLGDYTLTNRDGKPARLADYRGRPLVVQFIYTGCFAIWPTTTKFLGRAVFEAQRALGPDAFRVITVGFNLPFDTPEAMREFQRKQGIDLPNWEFLGADAATVDALARDTGFVWTPTGGGFDHLTQTTIVDGSGRVVRQIYGEAFELSMFVGPLKELVTGAAAPAQDLSSLLEKVRILCTVYDPRTGQYRLNYGLFIEIFVGLSVLGATAWYVIAGTRRGRSERRPA
jgi:protein SCO1/2